MTLAVLVPVLLIGLGVAVSTCQAKGVSCNIYVGNPPNTGK